MLRAPVPSSHFPVPAKMIHDLPCHAGMESIPARSFSFSPSGAVYTLSESDLARYPDSLLTSLPSFLNPAAQMQAQAADGSAPATCVPISGRSDLLFPFVHELYRYVPACVTGGSGGWRVVGLFPPTVPTHEARC